LFGNHFEPPWPVGVPSALSPSAIAAIGTDAVADCTSLSAAVRPASTPSATK
jgi:hypothetical protein